MREFRDAARVQALIQKIAPLADELAAAFGRPIQIMEVCGGHTHAIFRYGFAQLLPHSIEFIHGPGCPVCVLPVKVIDEAIAISAKADTILTTFGDPMRVPGTSQSLLQAKAHGADIRVVYSPLDALTIATKNPHKQVVFLAIGFDTTMPSTALTLTTAKAQGINNFSVLCHHIRLMPTLEALLAGGDIQLDGFIGPGHVSMVIGTDAYQPVAKVHHKPLVVAGFEPVDFLLALYQLLIQLKEGRCETENAYARVVNHRGNLTALAAMDSVFDYGEDCQWRGLGWVENSGVRIKPDFSAFDASKHFSPSAEPGIQQEPCYCQQVLKGQRKPNQCPLFAKHCKPEHPLGALMVSSEGACAAYYQYLPDKETGIHG
ncbi:hydrogenase formation protein HypD [Aliiglaciecola sp. CAU 1673]|uniref:hydrogenase formation protein HypD n=1 Tax=Aliiglaciecola sp. CAU 1673 TaxID=3032595 RepID=UPI0023DAB587|nr:hydrogenase formation protein HypD [Aliiglaciecola sp. CAU 1673]MDF2180187.1 hydrogenase formation protein HypD [Aliiglaciecola sp. CAU 1673]